MQKIRTAKVTRSGPALGVAARKILVRLYTASRGKAAGRTGPGRGETSTIEYVPREGDAELLAAALATRHRGGGLAITAAGIAWIARQNAALRAEHIDPFIAQHLAISARDIEAPEGRRAVVVDDTESPLGWLARRKGRDGQPLLAPHQLAAGERLRAEFTRAQLMPRVTSNWQAAVSQGSRAENGGRAANISETIVAARQRVRQALDAVGPEFSGLLIDICCFLKGLEEVERERMWPARSAKVVLQLGLDRLARHYGLGDHARGKSKIGTRRWVAPATANVVDG
jgi:hypothetical protein